jgi:hypothetical protein
MSILLRAALALALAVNFVPSGNAQTHDPSPITDEGASPPALFSSSRSSVDSVIEPLTVVDAPSAAPPGEGAVTRGQIAPAGAGWPLLSRLALGAYTTPLGVGVGVAAGLTHSTNLRFGWNFFNYNLTGTDDGATYAGHLHFRSLQASLDWFPFHGTFHVSPGLLFNNQNRVTASGGIAGGQSFTLNDTNYYSSQTDPVSGNGSVRFNSVAPLFTAGWGNWVSRREHKHLAFPFEAGFAYTGDASVRLNLQGTVCNTPYNVNCSQIATDPSVQANISGQIRKLQNDLEWIRFYPIISAGVTYKF